MHLLLSIPGRPNLARRFHHRKIVTLPPRRTAQNTTTSRTTTQRRSSRSSKINATTRHTRTLMAIAHITTIRIIRTIEATTVEPRITIHPVAVGNLTTAAAAAPVTEVTPALPRSETSRPVLLLLTKTNTRKSQHPGKMSSSKRATCPDQRSTFRPRMVWPTDPHRRRQRRPTEVTSPREAGVSRRRNRSPRIRPT